MLTVQAASRGAGFVGTQSGDTCWQPCFLSLHLRPRPGSVRSKTASLFRQQHKLPIHRHCAAPSSWMCWHRWRHSTKSLASVVTGCDGVGVVVVYRLLEGYCPRTAVPLIAIQAEAVTFPDVLRRGTCGGPFSSIVAFFIAIISSAYLPDVSQQTRNRPWFCVRRPKSLGTCVATSRHTTGKNRQESWPFKSVTLCLLPGVFGKQDNREWWCK